VLATLICPSADALADFSDPKRGHRDGEYVSFTVSPTYEWVQLTDVSRTERGGTNALGLDFAYGDAFAAGHVIAFDIGIVASLGPLIRLGAIYDWFPNTSFGAHLQAGLGAAIMAVNSYDAYGDMAADRSGDTGLYGGIGRLGVGFAFGGPGSLSFDLRVRVDGGAFATRGRHAWVGCASVELGLLSF
jgi:hypothetical protein